MRFTLELKELKRLITRARPAVGSANAPDVHRHVHLHVDVDGTVTVTATDGDLAAFATADGADTEPGEAVVLFSDLATVSKLKGARTSTTTELVGDEVWINHADSDTHHTVRTASSWVPHPVPLPAGPPVSLPALAFCIGAATDGDDQAPAGVFVGPDQVVATDGFLLSAVVGHGSDAGPVTLPPALVKAAARAKAPAHLAVGDGKVQLDAQEASYQAAAAGDDYPDWQHLLPAGDTPQLTGISTAELSDLAETWTKQANRERLAPTMVLHHGAPVRCTLQLDELLEATLDGHSPGDLAVAPEQLKALLTGMTAPELLIPEPVTGQTGGLLIARERQAEATWLRLLQQHVCAVEDR